MILSARLILVCTLVLVLAACAVSPRNFIDPRPMPTLEQRAVFGTIGIAALGETHPQEPRTPDSMSHVRKAGTSVGMGALGAGVGAIAGLGCGPFAPACVPGFAAIFGTVGFAGTLFGTITYRTAEQVNSAEITLRNALLSVNVEQRLIELVLAQTPNTSSQHLRQIGYSKIESSWDVGDMSNACPLCLQLRTLWPQCPDFT